jgi:hypothetical protein
MTPVKASSRENGSVVAEDEVLRPEISDNAAELAVFELSAPPVIDQQA